MKRNVLALFLALFFLVSATAFGQHFQFVRTDNNSSILVLEATINDEALIEDDEVGVFTPAELCAGARNVPAGFPDNAMGISAWGDRDGGEVDGFRPDEEFEFRFWEQEAEREHIAVAQYIVGAGVYMANGFNVVHLSVEVEEEENRRNRLNMNEDWNLISINVNPVQFYDGDPGPDIPAMFEPIGPDGEDQIVLLKDENGRFWTPLHNFINIPYWTLTEGYQVKLSEAVVYEIDGQPIPADTDVPLVDGWNIIAYFPTYQLDASAPDFYVLSPIIDNVLIAKDSDGLFLSTEFNFSNMNPWREMQGYQVKIEAEASIILNYPSVQEENAALVYAEPVYHWGSPASTGANMSVLVTSISGADVQEGDQIGAFDVNGCIIGAGMIDAEGRCGLAVWGEDPSTEEIDGLKSGEAFELRLRDTKYDKELSLNTVVFRENKSLVYETDSFVVLDVMAEQAIPENFYLADAYPNPFNAVARLSYGLASDTWVKIQIYDVSGRLVSTLIDEDQLTGHHKASWNGKVESSGIYFVQMKASDFNTTRKVVLVK